jgi:hypothetical protein
MFLIGAGLGMTMQNLVLSVQNQVATKEIGSASAFVSFSRTLGGAVGVSALGALLTTKITGYVADGLSGLGLPAGSTSSGEVPDLSTLPAPVRGVVEGAYGHGVGDVFLWAAPCAVLALIAIVFIKSVPLRTTNTAEELSPVNELAAEAGGVVLLEDDLGGTPEAEVEAEAQPVGR